MNNRRKRQRGGSALEMALLVLRARAYFHRSRGAGGNPLYLAKRGNSLRPGRCLHAGERGNAHRPQHQQLGHDYVQLKPARCRRGPDRHRPDNRPSLQMTFNAVSSSDHKTVTSTVSCTLTNAVTPANGCDQNATTWLPTGSNTPGSEFEIEALFQSNPALGMVAPGSAPVKFDAFLLRLILIR
jgi:hypothetical protein